MHLSMWGSRACCPAGRSPPTPPQLASSPNLSRENLHTTLSTLRAKSISYSINSEFYVKIPNFETNSLWNGFQLCLCPRPPSAKSPQEVGCSEASGLFASEEWRKTMWAGREWDSQVAGVSLKKKNQAQDSGKGTHPPSFCREGPPASKEGKLVKPSSAWHIP